MALARRDLDGSDQSGNEFNVNLPKLGKEAIRETRLSRFKQKINQFFKWEETTETYLSERILELRKNVVIALSDLDLVRKKIEAEVDPALHHVLTEIIDLLTNEIRALQGTLVSNTTFENERIYQKYNDAMEKVNFWIDLCQKPLKKDVVCDAVIRYNNNAFRCIIDHDLQIIQDYLKYSLEATHLEEEEKIQLEEQLQQQLQHHLKLLEELKKCPQKLDLENLGHWREKVNSLREVYFGTALHAIDLVMQEIKPPFIIEDESEHHVEIIKRLTRLESKISNMTTQIPKLAQDDEKRKHMYESQFSHLEEEVHDLNSDLRLSQDHVDRLQSLSHRLSIIRNKLK